MRVLLFCLASILPLPGRACDLALILAIDVSGSVDAREYGIQVEGLAAALEDGIVSEALVVGEAYLQLIQWTGQSRQVVSIPWTQVRTFDELSAFAGQVAAMPRHWRNYATAIGEALDLSLDSFATGPDCRRRVIDVSGDGRSNEGRPPEAFRPALRDAGVTVNALVIEGSEPGLLDYFRRTVIAGPEAFAISANGYADYPERIRQKLQRETAKALSSLAPPSRSAPRP